MQRISVIASLVLMTGCVSTTMPGGATEREVCIAWGESLPTRSRSDTDQTKAEIQRAYATFAAACPAFADLIP
jgi:hypothetical protein